MNPTTVVGISTLWSMGYSVDGCCQTSDWPFQACSSEEVKFCGSYTQPGQKAKTRRSGGSDWILGKNSSLQEWLGTGTGSPGQLSPCLSEFKKCLDSAFIQSLIFGWSSVKSGVGLHDPCESLPTRIILWFCCSVEIWWGMLMCQKLHHWQQPGRISYQAHSKTNCVQLCPCSCPFFSHAVSFPFSRAYLIFINVWIRAAI